MRCRKSFYVAAGGLFVAAMASVSAPLRAQQHGYSAEQIAEGRTLYENNCGRCHNNDGAGVPGVELFKQLRRATTDDDVAKLIQNGIPGTSMPQHRFSNPQALAVVAFLRSMVGASPTAVAAGAVAPRGNDVTGDPVHGREIFAGKGGCVACHRAGGAGGTSGPDLSAIAVPTQGFGPPQPDPAALERSILEPNADIVPAFRVFQVTPKTGGAIRGTLLNQDTFSIQLYDEAKNLRSFLKSDVKESGFLPSPMPSYRGRLTAQEVADLVAYLLTPKG